MNCKPGDLAFVVRGTQPGVVVTVEKIADPFPDGSAAWFATSRQMVKTIKRRSRKLSMSDRFRVRDSWLRPITGLPLDEETPVEHEVTA